MFEKDVALGVNGEGLNQLTVDIMTIADNVSLIFDEIDQKYASLKEYLKCDALSDIDNKYNQIKQNYATIKKNIISYSDDMVILNNKVSEGEKYLKNIVNQGTEKIQNMSKEVQ